MIKVLDAGASKRGSFPGPARSGTIPAFSRKQKASLTSFEKKHYLSKILQDNKSADAILG
jgi:hypothetical protein